MSNAGVDDGILCGLTASNEQQRLWSDEVEEEHDGKVMDQRRRELRDRRIGESTGANE